jgi:hypothetical protein
MLNADDLADHDNTATSPTNNKPHQQALPTRVTVLTLATPLLPNLSIQKVLS